MNTRVEKAANTSHTNKVYIRFFYGPLLLGYEGGSEINVPENAQISRTDARDYRIEGTNIHLSPVNHLMDSKVCKQSQYKKQIL